MPYDEVCFQRLKDEDPINYKNLKDSIKKFKSN